MAAAAAEPGGSLEDDRLFEQEFLSQRTLKFPSTAHLKNLGAATKDDKICCPERVRAFCGGGRRVTVEEKIDGANLGVSLDSSYQPRFQGRGHWVTQSSDNQFSGIQAWVEQYSGTLCELLERNRHILFGEWCSHLHTVRYRRLPGYFLAFDIYDRWAGRFLSRRAFHERLRAASGPKIPCVPVVASRVFSSLAEVEALLERQSAFGDGPIEGLYLKLDEEVPTPGAPEAYLLDRCKLVRADFRQAIVKTWRGCGRNGLDVSSLEAYVAQCYGLAGGDSDEAAEAGATGASDAAAAAGVAAAAGKGNYPQTPHFPFSPGVNPDDLKLADGSALAAMEVVITEKLDGGNCCIKGGQVYARTHAQPATHASFSVVKQLASELDPDAVEGLEIFGENMYAVHSIEYSNLTSFFYVFAVRRGGDWLAWDEVTSLAERLSLPTVPLVFRGRFAGPQELQANLERWAQEPSALSADSSPEGFVVRCPGPMAGGSFGDCIAKYVRASHIQTDAAWKRTWRRAHLGPALPPRPQRRPMDPRMEELKDPRQRFTIPVPGLGDVILPRNFSFVAEDLAVSSTPKKEHGREQVLAMAHLGIRLVVTLTEEEPLEASWFEGTGVENLFVPVRNYFPPSMAQVEQVAAAVARTCGAGHRAMVHCGGGKGRAGSVTCALLLRYGLGGIRAGMEAESQGAVVRCQMQSNEVLQHLRRIRPGSVETEKQEKFVREYAAQLWRGPEAAGPDSGAPAAAEAVDRPAQRGAKARREEREQEQLKKGLAKRMPRYLMLCGLPASGKSTFARALEEAGWTRTNQDEMGRKKCMEATAKAGRLAALGRARVVVDRCHLTREDRREMLEVLNAPSAKEVTCVFFDFPAEQSKRQAAARRGHETIREGGGARIVEDAARRLERPGAAEGFGAVEVVQSFGQGDALLARYGAQPAVPLLGSAPEAAVQAGSSSGSSWAPPAGGGSSSSWAPEVGVSSGSSCLAAAGAAQAEQCPGAPAADHGGAQAAAAAGCKDEEAESWQPLGAEFSQWLAEALARELAAADAESLFATAEVLLAAGLDDRELVDSTAEVIRDAGALRCAAELRARWGTCA